jgi:hypothetical protein
MQDIGPPEKGAARPSITSVEPLITGRTGTHRYSNPQILADRRTRAIALDRRLLVKTLQLMAEEDRLLKREHGPGGVRWILSPGGLHVPDRIAHRIINCENVEPHDAGLFPGSDVAQSFRIRRN